MRNSPSADRPERRGTHHECTSRYRSRYPARIGFVFHEISRASSAAFTALAGPRLALILISLSCRGTEAGASVCRFFSVSIANSRRKFVLLESSAISRRPLFLRIFRFFDDPARRLPPPYRRSENHSPLLETLKSAHREPETNAERHMRIHGYLFRRTLSLRRSIRVRFETKRHHRFRTVLLLSRYFSSLKRGRSTSAGSSGPCVPARGAHRAKFRRTLARAATVTCIRPADRSLDQSARANRESSRSGIETRRH